VSDTFQSRQRKDGTFASLGMLGYGLAGTDHAILTRGAPPFEAFDVGGAWTAQEVSFRELRLDLSGHHAQSHASLVRHEDVR